MADWPCFDAALVDRGNRAGNCLRRWQIPEVRLDLTYHGESECEDAVALAGTLWMPRREERRAFPGMQQESGGLKADAEESLDGDSEECAPAIGGLCLMPRLLIVQIVSPGNRQVPLSHLAFLPRRPRDPLSEIAAHVRIADILAPCR